MFIFPYELAFNYERNLSTYLMLAFDTEVHLSTNDYAPLNGTFECSSLFFHFVCHNTIYTTTEAYFYKDL